MYLTGQIMAGPLNVRDSKPLPPDLDEFVSNSGGHGFIIVSFGSNVASLLPRQVVDMLATAFGKLKQRVVWRLKGNVLLHQNTIAGTRQVLVVHAERCNLGLLE